MTWYAMSTLSGVTSTVRNPDPTRRWEVTKRAMTLYLTVTQEKDFNEREYYREWINHLPAVVTEDDYAERLEEIRDRAYQDHVKNDGDNCDEGTTRFLDAFGLEPLAIATRKRVTVTAIITFYVDNDTDEYATQDDVERYLRIDVSGNVDDMDDDASVHIDRVEVETDN